MAVKVEETTMTNSRRDIIFGGICNVLRLIWNHLFKPVFKFLFMTRGPGAYVVWIIIIILLIVGGITGFGLRKKNRSKNNTLVNNPNVIGSKLPTSNLSGKSTNDGWRTRAVQDTTKAGSAVDGYARNTLSDGRCDGLDWISDPVSSKYCMRNLPPPTIRWEFNSDTYTDLDKIPESWLNKHVKEKTINIPYVRAGDKFHVDCSNMTYDDDTEANLFIQKGGIKDTKCQMIEKTFASPYTAKTRKTEPKDKYTVCA